jgi:proteasome accessory factor B
MSANKLERLLNLTAVLLETSRPLAAEELRERVEGYPPPGPAFHRAFERDKEDLRVLGIPLRVERVPATNPPVDGYRIEPDEYYLPDPALEPDELAALHLASLAVRMEGMGEREALWKLGGLSADGAATDDAAAGPLDGARLATIPSNPALEPLFEAIAARRVVEFGYRTESRTVEPWRLDFQRGRWYLTGWDRNREAERNFRLDRIDTDVHQTGESVTTAPPAARVGTVAQPWEIGDDEHRVDAKILVDGVRAEEASRLLGPAVQAQPGPDGSRIFTVPVLRFEPFRTFLLNFLDHAELLEPPEWRDRIVGWLEDLAEGHGRSADQPGADGQAAGVAGTAE